jgi:hypothetical protein
MAGLIGPGRAEHLLDLDLTLLLAFIEGILCESEENAERIQQMYEDAKPAAPVVRGEQRRAEVAAFLAMAG